MELEQCNNITKQQQNNGTMKQWIDMNEDKVRFWCKIV